MNPKSVMLRACVAVIGAQDPVDPSGSKSGNVRTLFPSEGERFAESQIEGVFG